MSLNWYVLRAISGKENKIKTYLEKEINRNNLQKFIPEIMIPHEKVYVMRNCKKKMKERNYLPGYVLVSADFSHGEVQQVVRSVPGVIGFLGSGTGASKVPIPLRESEINRLFGNFSLRYQQSANLVLESTVRTDMYDFVIEDRLGSGGLETDF